MLALCNEGPQTRDAVNEQKISIHASSNVDFYCNLLLLLFIHIKRHTMCYKYTSKCLYINNAGTWPNAYAFFLKLVEFLTQY